MTQFFVLFDLIYNMLGTLICVMFVVQVALELGLENWDHSRVCFDASKLAMTSNLAKNLPCEITFIEVTFETSFLAEIGFCTSRAWFWFPSVPLDSFRHVEFNFDL